MRLLKFIVLLSLFSSQIYAANVNCNNASNWLGKAICKQPELKALNDQLSEAYKTALNKSQNPEIIKNEQNMWLQNFIDNEDAIEGHYTDDNKFDSYLLSIFESRIAVLKKGDKREKLGDCRDDRINSINKNGYGDISLSLQSGIFISVDQNVIPANDFNIGYKVKLCLKRISACGMDEENMSKKYSLQSYKDPKNIITGWSSMHMCMSQGSQPAD